MSTLSVSRIEVDAIKGIAHAELNLKGRSLTVIRGANSVGKSSLLDAVASIFQGGSDPSLVRQGAKSGRVRLELSNGVVIEKLQTAKGATLKVTDANGEAVASPQKYVQELATSFAFSPLDFLRAPKNERAAFAAKHANLSFQAKELRNLKFGQLDVGAPVRELVGPDAVLSLEDFDRLRKTVYEKRKAANLLANEAEKSVNSLRKSLPLDEPGETPAANLPRLQKELAALDEGERRDLTAVGAEAEAARATARLEYDRQLTAIYEAESEAVNEVKRGNEAERTRLQQAIAEAQAGLKRAGEVAALSKHLEQQQERLSEKSTEAKAFDQALDAMDALKKSKLDNLPIPGLTIENGEVFRNGIPFDQLNHAQRYVTALEIGALGLGELPLVISDEGESLDEKEFAVFCEAIKESGMQVIVARVDQGDLRSEPQGALKL